MNAKVIHGYTALMRANLRGRLDIVRELLNDTMVDLRDRNIAGSTAHVIAHCFKIYELKAFLVSPAGSKVASCNLKDNHNCRGEWTNGERDLRFWEMSCMGLFH